MNGFTHHIVTTEREGDIRHTARNFGVRQATFNATCGIDKVHAVVIVFFNPRADSKNVRVKNNIFRWKAHLVHKNVVSSGTDFYFAFFGVRLPHFVKRHHDHRRTITANQFRLVDKFFFAFFEGNGVYNSLTLHRLQTGFNHFPLGRVNHHRHFCRIRFGRHNVKETGHTFLRVEQGFVHIYVNHLRTVFHLIDSNFNGFAKFLFFNQTLKLRRTCYVIAFAHVYKQAFIINV